MKKKIVELIIIFVFYILQITLGRVIGIGGIKPNLLIILPVMFGFLNGRNEGMFTGFVSGILFDLNSSLLLGFSALVFVYIGYFAGMFSGDYDDNFHILPIGILAGGSFVYGFLSYVGNFLLFNRLDVSFFVIRYIVPEMIYTVLIMVLVYKPLVLIERRLSVNS